MSSYASTYVMPEKALIRTLAQTHAHFTGSLYRYLADSADDYGACFPSIRHLAEVLNSSKEAVQTALEELEQMGVITYLRRSAHDPRTGHYLANIYQINPALLHIRPELHDQAQQQYFEAGGRPLTLLGTGSSQPVDAPVRELPSSSDITNNRTSDSLTSFNPKGYNQQQQKTPESELRLSGDSEKPSANMGREKPETQPKAEHPTKPTAEKPETSLPYQQQRSANSQTFRAGRQPKTRPTYPELAPVARALPDEFQERLAKRVREETDIPLRLARGLITQYGWNTVEVALNNPFVRKANNPGGYLRWLIQGQRIDPQADLPIDPMERLRNRLENDAKRYTSGEYADFIQH